MTACCCSLAGTSACINCPNNPARMVCPPVFPCQPMLPFPQWLPPGTKIEYIKTDTEYEKELAELKAKIAELEKKIKEGNHGKNR